MDIYKKPCALDSRQVSVLGLCFVMKLDGIVEGWMVITVCKYLPVQ